MWFACGSCACSESVADSVEEPSGKTVFTDVTVEETRIFDVSGGEGEFDAQKPGTPSECTTATLQGNCKSGPIAAIEAHLLQEADFTHGAEDEEDSTLRSVTCAESEAAALLQQRVMARPELLAVVDQFRGGESLRALCVRFTRARPQSLDAAFHMLSSDMEYRKDRSVGFARMTAEEVMPGEIAGVSLLQEYCKHLPNAVLGRDMEGRPVIYRRFHDGTRWSELVKLGVSVQMMARYNAWFLEGVLESVGHKGQWTIICDIGGIALRSCDSTMMNFIHQLGALDAAHYPERLGKCFIINAPSFMPWFWRAISSWMNAKTRQKVSVLGRPDEWQPVLAATLDLKILPDHLGGAAAVSGWAIGARSGQMNAQSHP